MAKCEGLTAGWDILLLSDLKLVQLIGEVRSA